MKEITQLSKRLREVVNLSLFARTHKLKYRTLTRIRAGNTPSAESFIQVDKALKKEGL